VSGLRAAVTDYLAVRRALGYQLTDAGRLLAQFVDFAEAADATTITTQLAVRWAVLPGRSTTWHAQRLSAVRGFARWRQAFDPGTEVPPPDLLPTGRRRATRYLYSEGDIAALLDAASRLRPALAAATMQAFIGLVFTTGMRRGEVLGLDREDLDRASGVLTIREAKFHKPRQVPLHPSTLAALTNYAARRDRLCPHPSTPAFFVSSRGNRLAASTVSQNFRALLHRTGINEHHPAGCPRIHDARHTFAVTTLLRWYRDGDNVQARLPVLSAYLGHTDPRHTYWYLSAAPELLALVAERLEHGPGARP
jgi:integrase